MCGGWRQDKPKPYQLVVIRELVKKDLIEVDIIHVGYWAGVCWCALSAELEDGTKLPRGSFKGIGIENIYGWQHLQNMEPNV